MDWSFFFTSPDKTVLAVLALLTISFAQLQLPPAARIEVIIIEPAWSDQKKQKEPPPLPLRQRHMLIV